MKTREKFIVVFSLLFIFKLILIQPAHAYLDPGTVSYALQIVVAAFVGILATVKIFWHKIKYMFSKKDK